MRCDRFALDGDPAALVGELRKLVPAAGTVTAAVAEIVGRVRAEGDLALLDYTRALDTPDAEPKPLRVTEEELDAALAQLDPEVHQGLKRAVGNVEAVAAARGHRDTVTVDLVSHVVRLRSVPVARAGVYVPGGRASYPSTAVMGVIPARVAGAQKIAVCTPPGPDGEVSPLVMAACRLAGASAVYRMGGAQAIAALAYGTESVDPVDVIVGPGNLYVQEAKRQVSGEVGIDSFAGPSDLLVISDGSVDPALVALDLLAQAEHGSGTLVVAVSDSDALLSALADRLETAPETEAAAALVEVEGPEAALALSEAFAPEHLQLMGPAAEELAPRITRAGCVFVGGLSATAFGDYIAGSNHILPTGGAARFASALSPQQFLRTATEVRIAEASELAREAAPVARAEGFELHAQSMEIRIRDNPPP